MAILVSVLYFATTIAQLSAGRAAEVSGPRRVFTDGAVLVLAGGVVGGFASGLTALIISQVDRAWVPADAARQRARQPSDLRRLGRFEYRQHVGMAGAEILAHGQDQVDDDVGH